MSDEVKNRIEYNRAENERFFQSIMSGMSTATIVAFQMRLLDGMFSVIEAEDFKMICLKIVHELGGVTRQ